MRSSWVRMGPKSNDKCPYKKKDTDISTEKAAMRRWGQRLEQCICNRGTLKISWPLEAGREAWGGFSLRASAEETDTVNNLISDFCPQNNKRMHLYCFKPLNLCQFVVATPRKLIHCGNQLFSYLASSPDREPPKAGTSLNSSLCSPGYLWTWC